MKNLQLTFIFIIVAFAYSCNSHNEKDFIGYWAAGDTTGMVIITQFREDHKVTKYMLLNDEAEKSVMDFTAGQEGRWQIKNDSIIIIMGPPVVDFEDDFLNALQGLVRTTRDSTKSAYTIEHFKNDHKYLGNDNDIKGKKMEDVISSLEDRR